MWDKSKQLVLDDTFFVAILLVLIALGSFALGRVSQSAQSSDTAVPRVSLEAAAVVPSVTASTEESTVQNKYVGSKNGTKFHLPNCPGAGQIHDENKVFFATKEIAYSSGYTEAANCEGI